MDLQDHQLLLVGVCEGRDGMAKSVIYLRGNKCKSIDMLKAQLEERGHQVVRGREEGGKVCVCWGMSTRGWEHNMPVLNAKVNTYDKYQSLKRFRKAGLTVPAIFPVLDAIDHVEEQPFPWFARKIYHEKGNDITVCKTEADAMYIASKRSADFFSVYVPHDAELRAWVFNGKTFAIYQKIYRNPGIMNFKILENNIQLRDDLLAARTPLVAAAVKAVAAMGMDFGAVDALVDREGRCTILEVNSMPEIDCMTRVNGIRLAKNISAWAEQRR